jgi:hypothetical protein
MLLLRKVNVIDAMARVLFVLISFGSSKCVDWLVPWRWSQNVPRGSQNLLRGLPRSTTVCVSL